MKNRWNQSQGFAAVFAAILVGATRIDAAPPDLTAGGTIPSNLTTTWNLGPTGMRGWVYYDTTSGGINGSVESRQIQVREVDAGSPADGVFLANDLILGASGTAAAPVLFDIDARRGLANAIADAEAQDPASLKLIRWRAGAQTEVTLTLRTMGAYSATAPYNCPKSEKILEEGVDHYYNSESSGRYRMGVLSLLAAQDDFFPDRALYLQEAQSEARALIKSASTLNALRNYTASTAYSAPWGRVHELILLGEYYLITGDAQVFPTIEALAINLAKGLSHYGTMAHSLRQGPYDPSNPYRPVNTGYGVVNSVGMPCLVGMQLAKQCGVNDPVVDDMIDRAKMFYASYANRGAIPYGEHEPFDARHENNGKSGLAAIVLDNDPAYESQAEFFAMMALASGDTDRDVGHTGAYFNYLWAPLGVQRGGPAAVQEYFKKIRWQLDLHRRWDGGFDYDSYSENRAPNGSEYYDFRMSTAMLLIYALPLESLHITGRDSTGAVVLSPAQISDSVDVEDYDANTRSIAQLVSDLGAWSPKVRLLASAELGEETIDTATRDDLRAKALDVNGSSRYGAIQALGEINDTGFTGQLVSLLNDNDGYVRTLAAKALQKFASSHKVPYRASMMTTLVSRDRPAFPVDPNDPLQFDQAALISNIFGSGGFANSRSEMDTLISQVGNQLFFDALKVASRHPVGAARGRISNLYNALTPAEVNLMAPELVDMLALEAPADRMFSLGVRAEAMRAMQRSLLAEAVPSAMQAMDHSNGWGGFHENLLNVLIGYGGSSTLVEPDPDVVAFAQRYLTGATLEEAQAVLDAIAADTNPPPPSAFKSITSATADDPILTLPADSTVLRVSGFDYLQGDSIYTWSKIAGPGVVTISPNGTTDTASTVEFDGTTGTYQFKVTMSDSRGLTEVHENVTVFVVAEGELDNAPPLPNPASFDLPPTADSETAVSMTATIGTDASGPVEYLFSEITGNPGGTSSGWQTSPSYTDSGLSPLTYYAYRVTMRDSEGNTGTPSSVASVNTPGTPPPSDIISVNFYAYGGLATENRDKVTLEANETAGFGGWRTGGWVNYLVPWGLSSPRPPVSISSGLGSTASLILNDVRNGGPYNNPNPHVLLPGDGNGDLMDGHCNGTEDPYDESAKFDMVVSNVPFATYDVIVYVGANKAQFGNGTGKYVFNGGAEQDFKLTSGEFMSFAQITNATTPGNYLLFENVTGSSFTLRMWGNGFNHIGPTGFQIASAGTTSDVDPPTPTTASFASPPQANGADSISMTATTGTDASGPVEYLFSCLSAGGHGSGWQTSPSYTDSGLNPETEYLYTITMRDARGNTGTASAPAGATTQAVADVDAPNPNPMNWAVVPTAISSESISMTASTATDSSGVEYYFEETTGNPGGSDSGWQAGSTYVDSGLDPSTSYSYQVKARDKSPGQNETGFSSLESATTTAPIDNTPPTPDPMTWAAAPAATSGTAITMTASTASDPSGVEYFFAETSGNPGGNDSGWQDSPTYTDSGLSPGTTYTYTVTARDKSPAQNTSAPSVESPATTTGSPPLKVFILAGQSNMEGHGEMNPAFSQGTLDYLVTNDPANYGHLKDGANWAEWDDVWISYKRGGTTLLNGDLSAGYGVSATTIGPELQFGVELGNYLGEQVLLIKTAWGGKSLYVDFRPPTSGWSVNPPTAAGQQGFWYQQMLSDVSDALANLSTTFPDYATIGSYEFAGFGWHQGWNDRVDSNAVAEYEANMENFIKDVRLDLATIHPSGADIPFVIATTGIGGPNETGTSALALMDAQLAMEDFDKYPEFEGNVAVVDTREFWREASESPADQGFHWNRNAESYFLIGQSMATHMRVLLEGGDTNPPDPSPMTWATPPTAAGEGEITMTATTATDIIGVEYYFEETSGNPGGDDSGWQNSPTYLDTGLDNSTSYSYRVKARDKSPDQNETAWSTVESTNTTPADTTAPTPDPMTWAVAPTPLSSRVITMTASTASDPSGVEYYFTNTTISGHDSGWQDSPSYTDANLDPSTSYTYQVKARDKSVAANETALSAPTVATTLDAPPPGPLLYEPFDDLDPTLNGNTPGPGFSGTWSASSNVSPGSLSYGSLSTSGGRATTGSSQFQQNGISPGTTLNNAGLMVDGSTLWFSALIVNYNSVPAPTTDNRTYLALGTGNADGFDRIGGTPGSGFTVAVSKVSPGGVTAQAWNDGSDGTGGATRGSTVTVPNNATFLAVGKITWGKFGVEDDVFELYLPGTDLVQGAPISVIAADFDQLGVADPENAFDTISFTGGRPNLGVPEVDEIRFGATYADVVVSTDDTTAPTPDPMTWAAVPAATSSTAITMTASTASDPSGVEYFFEETSGNPGGSDSVWQNSPTYIDTGLNPSTTYSYRVRARDKSSNNNETGFSSLESATTDAVPDNTPPTPDPMTWAAVPAATSSTSITMTASTASDPSGVEYFFEETSGNPGGDDSGWQNSPIYTDSGLDPSTTYSYQVKARDKSSNNNETGLSPLESATTDAGAAPPLIYEPFNDLNPSLAGNTPGLGLTGTWSGQSLVADGSLTYGKLGYQGGRVVTNPGNNVDSCGVSPGTTLTNAGLMADGASLWFSVLIEKHPDTSPSTNDRKTYVSLGTGAPDGFDRIGGDSGSGFAVVLNQSATGTDRIQGWNNDSDGAGGAFRSPLVSYGAEGSTVLAVGKITWGAFGVTNDVFELYIPDKDLNLGSPVSTLSGNFDQLGTVNADNAFDTIGFAGNRSGNNVPEIDEIRFGATSASVLPLDTIAPVLVTTDNASGSGFQRFATFDEEIYVGTGEIRIVNETTSGTTTITLPDPQVVTTGNTLTIAPTLPLGDGIYHIEIDAGALTDRNLNTFAGISDPDLWQFTVDVSVPTVTTFTDNTSPKPILINTSGRLVYTVTFSEAIDPGTLTTADFAATAGSVPITVDSVSATGDPAVFEVAVSTLGTTGTLTLEIVAAAVITDVNGNPLDATAAIPSDNTLTVNAPVPNAGGITNDFQTTIASQSNPNNTGGGEGRYFHVSVNEDNPGTGWYCANDTSGTPVAAGVRNFTGPVVAYKMLGNSSNGDVTSTAGAGGEPDRITYTSSDLSFDGFGQQQMRLWTANDPGADLATGAGTGATGFDGSVGNYGYRDMSGAKGFVDLSGLASGSVHIYYGSYNSTPTLKITLRDSDNVGADIVIADAHSIAGGGNGDAANLCEYYLAEIDFVTDGVYDVLEYEWTSPNGRGLGTVLTGPDAVVGNPYDTWAGGPFADTLSDPTPSVDFDQGSLETGLEWVLGGDPTLGSDDADIAPTFDNTSDLDFFIFTYRRADEAAADANTAIKVEFGSDLAGWTEAVAGADIVITPFDDGAAVGIDLVEVKIRRSLAVAGTIFARLNVVVTTP